MTPYATYSLLARQASSAGWRLKLTEVKEKNKGTEEVVGWEWCWLHAPTNFRTFGETTACTKPVALVIALDSVPVVGVF